MYVFFLMIFINKIKNMKKVIRLTESDLVRIVKRVLNEQNTGVKPFAKYITEYNHVLSKNGKTININKGDVWKQKGLGAEELDFMEHEKSGIVFVCDPSLASIGFISSDDDIYKYQNSKALINSLRTKFCNGKQFNYNKYVSTECVQGLKSGREGFKGCNQA